MLHDLRHAIRMLLRDGAYALPAVLLLALGVASNTAMLSILDAYLLQPLPYPDADRLVSVRPLARDAPASLRETVPDGLESVRWPEQDPVVEVAVSWDLDVFTLLDGDRPEVVSGAWVPPSYFRALRTRPALGRLFDDADGRPGAPGVAVLGHDLWMRRYGGSPDVLGRTLASFASDRPDDPETFTVVGVLPEDFWFVNSYTEMFTNLTARQMPYVLRLRTGVTPERAASHLTGIVRTQLAGIDPEWPGMAVTSLHAGYVRQVRPVLLVASAAVAFVLAIACGNVALLLAVRSLGRQRELDLRRALGASGWRLSRQLAAEGLVLAVTSGALGVGLALLLLEHVAPLAQTELGVAVPGTGAIGIRTSALAAAFLTCAVVGIVFALAPVVSMERRNLATALRSSASGASDTRQRRLVRSAWIAVEVGLSLVLLVGCLLMIRTAVHLQRVPLGFDPEGVVTAYLSLRQHSYAEEHRLAGFADGYLERVLATPGVRSAAVVAGGAPFQSRRGVPVAGRDEAASSTAALYRVSSEYFETLAVPLVQGRAFNSADREEALPVAVLSERLAREIFPGEPALGRIVRIGDAGEPRRVIGVVRDVRETITGDEELPDVYVPFAQAPSPFPYVVAKLARPPGAVVPVLQRLVWEIDDTAALTSIAMLSDLVSRERLRPRFLTALLTGFGAFAVALAVAGLYATVAYAVRQRRRDVAIRMALGAEDRDVVRLFLLQAAVVILAGIAGGVLASLALTRALASQLHGVSPLDGTAYLSALLILAGSAGLAVWLPARRAAATDPMAVLRQD